MLVASTAAHSPASNTSTANMSTPTARTRQQELSPNIQLAVTGRPRPGVVPVPSRDGGDEPI